MPRQFVNPPSIHDPIMPYSHAIVAGKTVYIAAQLPLNKDGQLVGADDPARQAEQVFSNLREVLTAAGGSLDHVVKLTTYLVSLDDRPAVMEARNRAFGQHRAPSILAIVRELPVLGARVEVDGIAVLD
jgi:enamine deaminase RidA (YjgF/YER057c/UK114 family)